MVNELPENALLKFTLASLAVFAPVVLPAVAFAVGARLNFWWRTAIVVLASLLSLPLGFVLMLLAHDPALFGRSHINPGVGVAAIPVMHEWIIVFGGIVVVALWLGIGRILSGSKR